MLHFWDDLRLQRIFAFFCFMIIAKKEVFCELNSLEASFHLIFYGFNEDI